MSRRYKLSQLADIVGGTVRGPGDVVITGVADVAEAGREDVTWLASSKYAGKLEKSRAGAVLLESNYRDTPMPAILCDHIEGSIAKLLGAFLEEASKPEPGIHPTAIIDPSAQVGCNPSIGPHVVVDQAAKIGESCVIHAGVFIGKGTVVGDECVFWPNVVIRDGCCLGHRITIHPNAVIGTDGLGYYFEEGQHHKYPHAGGVRLGDDVEIGACSCIDRAKFGYTEIGRGTKIDNLVQIGHNVRVGEHCVLAGQVGISGSVRIGHYCLFGGNAGVVDNVQIGNQVQLAGGLTIVTKDIPDGMMVSGFPAREHRQAMRDQAAMKRLPTIVERLHELTERVKQLEASTHHQP